MPIYRHWFSPTVLIPKFLSGSPIPGAQKEFFPPRPESPSKGLRRFARHARVLSVPTLSTETFTMTLLILLACCLLLCPSISPSRTQRRALGLTYQSNPPNPTSRTPPWLALQDRTPTDQRLAPQRNEALRAELSKLRNDALLSSAPSCRQAPDVSERRQAPNVSERCAKLKRSRSTSPSVPLLCSTARRRHRALLAQARLLGCRARREPSCKSQVRWSRCPSTETVAPARRALKLSTILKIAGRAAATRSALAHQPGRDSFRVSMQRCSTLLRGLNRSASRRMPLCVLPLATNQLQSTGATP